MSGFSGEKMSKTGGVTAGSDEALLSGDSTGIRFDGVLNTTWEIITVQIQKPLISSSVHWLQLIWFKCSANIIWVPYSYLATVWHCMNDTAHDQTEGNSWQD